MKLSGAEIFVILLFGLALVHLFITQILPEWQGKKCAEWKPKYWWRPRYFDRCKTWV